MCAARKLLSSPLLNYYLTSLYQVHRGRNATVVQRRRGTAGGCCAGAWYDDDDDDDEGWRESHGTLLLYILLPDVDSTDLHKETNAVVTLADCESDRERRGGGGDGSGGDQGMFLVSPTSLRGDACRLSPKTRNLRCRRCVKRECQYVSLSSLSFVLLVGSSSYSFI